MSLLTSIVTDNENDNFPFESTRSLEYPHFIVRVKTY